MKAKTNKIENRKREYYVHLPHLDANPSGEK